MGMIDSIDQTHQVNCHTSGTENNKKVSNSRHDLILQEELLFDLTVLIITRTKVLVNRKIEQKFYIFSNC